MKFSNEVMSFKISRVQSRNHVARDMLDRNGPYRERVISQKKIKQNRKPKNMREYFFED